MVTRFKAAFHSKSVQNGSRDDTACSDNAHDRPALPRSVLALVLRPATPAQPARARMSRDVCPRAPRRSRPPPGEPDVKELWFRTWRAAAARTDTHVDQSVSI